VKAALTRELNTGSHAIKVEPAVIGGGETLNRWNMVTVQHDIGWLREQNRF